MMVGGSHSYGGHHHHPGDLADLSFTISDRDRHHSSTVSLLDSIERRTQRTYRYGIGLVCIGATLNWLGFAQGNSYIDPLRYLGVACVISGSFCVCLAMCRWLGRPISLSGHRVSGLEEDSLSSRVSGEVHVINVAVPLYMPSMHEEYRPLQKPPDYDIVAHEPQPPPYDEAIKLTPGALFQPQPHPHLAPQGHLQSNPPDYENQLRMPTIAPEGGGVYRAASPSHSQSDNSSTALLIQNNEVQKVNTKAQQGSPPPPYHPSPSRYNRPHSPSLPLISGVISSNKYHMRGEQEKFQRGHRSSEEDALLLTCPLLLQEDEVGSTLDLNLTPLLAMEGQILMTSGIKDNDNNNNINNQIRKNSHTSVILTDGDDRISSSSSILIQDSESDPFNH